MFSVKNYCGLLFPSHPTARCAVIDSSGGYLNRQRRKQGVTVLRYFIFVQFFFRLNHCMLTMLYVYTLVAAESFTK